MSLLRYLELAGRYLLRTVQLCVPSAHGPGLTVLAYHLVGAGSDSAVDLPVELFSRHLDELVEHAEVVSLLAGVSRLEGSPREGGRPLVALTFDDAYRNFLTHAWPLLAARELPVTLFVPVGFVRGESPPPNRDAPGPPATLPELRDVMAATGRLELGSHTWSHPDLTELSNLEVDNELRRSQKELERWTDGPVSCFCYPRGLWTPRIAQRVKKVYDVAVTGGGGRWRPGDDPRLVQRVSLRRDGPRSLLPLLRSRVWLEERFADWARGRRR